MILLSVAYPNRKSVAAALRSAVRHGSRLAVSEYRMTVELHPVTFRLLRCSDEPGVRLPPDARDPR